MKTMASSGKCGETTIGEQEKAWAQDAHVEIRNDALRGSSRE